MFKNKMSIQFDVPNQYAYDYFIINNKLSLDIIELIINYFQISIIILLYFLKVRILLQSLRSGYFISIDE